MKIKNTFAIAILIFSLSFIASAGISSPYWADNPLYMNAGETKVIYFNLQNMVGGTDINVKAEVTEGLDIASIQEDTFAAKAGTSDNFIPMTITIPSDYDKSIQKVKLEVKTIQEDQSGMVSLGSGWSSSFDVIISKEPSSSSYSTFLIIIAVIIVVVIAGFLLSKKKKSKKKK